MKGKEKFVIISGISGSGKSTAIKAFEDIGFYCVDNLPTAFLPKFIELCQLSGGGINRAAVGVDIREKDFLREFPEIFRKLRQEAPLELIFLESSEKVLLRRFSETRRRHPLDMNEGSLSEVIGRESKALSRIRAMSDRIIDTSEMTVHELKNILFKAYRPGDRRDAITVSLVSFGYKYGLPYDADIILDVRFLPNPYFIEELRLQTGQSEKVKDFILSFPETKRFLKKIEEFLTYLLPLYISEGKSYLTVGLGCTGGVHRSVCLVEALKERLGENGYHIQVNHRDIKESL
jgi:UPF0042 nucleotide-binding protein